MMFASCAMRNINWHRAYRQMVNKRDVELLFTIQRRKMTSNEWLCERKGKINFAIWRARSKYALRHSIFDVPSCALSFFIDKFACFFCLSPIKNWLFFVVESDLTRDKRYFSSRCRWLRSHLAACVRPCFAYHFFLLCLFFLFFSFFFTN